jgi:hypothetical protein
MAALLDGLRLEYCKPRASCQAIDLYGLVAAWLCREPDNQAPYLVGADSAAQPFNVPFTSKQERGVQGGTTPG